MSQRTVTGWLAPIASLLAVLGLLVALPVSLLAVHPQAAQASVTAGAIVFEQDKVGPPNYQPTIESRASNGTLVDLSYGSGGNADQFPDVSPDGSKIAFIGDRPDVDNGNYNSPVLMVMNSDGSGQTELVVPTSTGELDDSPVWSPNGTQIAFGQEFDNNKHYVAVINADGTGEKTLSSAGNEAFNPTWSPNGSMIAYESITVPASGRTQLYIMNANGSNVHSIANSDTTFNDHAPTWSPTGKVIYFTSSAGRGIWSYTSSTSFASGSAKRSASTLSGTNGPNGGSGGSYVRTSANGSMLTYSAPDSSGYEELWTISSSGGTSNQLTTDGSTYQNYEPTFVSSSYPTPPPTVYAALGDSYSSGEGNPPFIPDSNFSGDRCHRSLSAYSEHLAAVSGPQQFEFVACSGAETTQITSANQANHEAAQTAALSNLTTLVTITIGGNDIGFENVAEDCVFSPQSCKNSENAKTVKAIKALGPKLVSTYAAIHAAAPNALLVVGGYPELFATTSIKDCRGVTGISTSERTWLNSMSDLLNSTIRAAVAKDKAAGRRIAFAPVVGAVPGTFTGHALCSGSASVYLRGETIPKEYSFHPNAAGQLAYAAAFDAAIKSAA